MNFSSSLSWICTKNTKVRTIARQRDTMCASDAFDTLTCRSAFVIWNKAKQVATSGSRGGPEEGWTWDSSSALSLMFSSSKRRMSFCGRYKKNKSQSANVHACIHYYKVTLTSGSTKNGVVGTPDSTREFTFKYWFISLLTVPQRERVEERVQKKENVFIATWESNCKSYEKWRPRTLNCWNSGPSSWRTSPESLSIRAFFMLQVYREKIWMTPAKSPEIKLTEISAGWLTTAELSRGAPKTTDSNSSRRSASWDWDHSIEKLLGGWLSTASKSTHKVGFFVFCANYSPAKSHGEFGRHVNYNIAKWVRQHTINRPRSQPRTLERTFCTQNRRF